MDTLTVHTELSIFFPTLLCIVETLALLSSPHKKEKKKNINFVRTHCGNCKTFKEVVDESKVAVE